MLPSPATLRSPAVGSALIHSWSCHQPTALRSADSSRLTVRASVVRPRPASAAASLTPDSGWSSTASGTTGGTAPRRSAPRGAGRPTSAQAQLVREIR